MKRSEAISKIEEIYETYCGILPANGFAEEVLDALEENGMKPPLEKRCPVLLRNEHVWENENEQNPGT